MDISNDDFADAIKELNALEEETFFPPAEIRWVKMAVATDRLAVVNRYTPAWMEQADPGRLRGEMERTLAALKARLAEEQAAPFPTTLRVEWSLSAEVIAAAYPEQVAGQLSFDEFADLMEGADPRVPIALDVWERVSLAEAATTSEPTSTEGEG